MSNEGDRYAARGVSSQKEEVHAAISKLDKGLVPKAFCKVLPDFLTGDDDFGLLMHADGAGTKSSLAWAYWRETGDLSVWKGIAQDALVMNTDDLLCVGATGPMVVSSSIGRNKNLVPGEVIAALIEGTQELMEKFYEWGLPLHNSGGETADLGDLVRTLVVDSTFTTRIRRTDIINNADIAPNQVIVGLASYGKAQYETQWNAGIGSNGLTSARHDLLNSVVAIRYPESYDPRLGESLAYTGPYYLTDKPEVFKGLTVAEAILSPTRTYVPIMLPFLKENRSAIKGMIHCTGGGQTKVLHFVEGVKIVKNNLFETPDLFKEIQKRSKSNWSDMYATFNMGHRLEVYTDFKTAEALIKASQAKGVEAKIIGEVQKSDSGAAELEIVGPEGLIKIRKK